MCGGNDSVEQIYFCTLRSIRVAVADYPIMVIEVKLTESLKV